MRKEKSNQRGYRRIGQEESPLRERGFQGPQVGFSGLSRSFQAGEYGANQSVQRDTAIILHLPNCNQDFLDRIKSMLENDYFLQSVTYENLLSMPLCCERKESLYKIGMADMVIILYDEQINEIPIMKFYLNFVYRCTRTLLDFPKPTILRSQTSEFFAIHLLFEEAHRMQLEIILPINFGLSGFSGSAQSAHRSRPSQSQSNLLGGGSLNTLNVEPPEEADRASLLSTGTDPLQEGYTNEGVREGDVSEGGIGGPGPRIEGGTRPRPAPELPSERSAGREGTEGFRPCSGPVPPSGQNNPWEDNFRERIRIALSQGDVIV